MRIHRTPYIVAGLVVILAMGCSRAPEPSRPSSGATNREIVVDQVPAFVAADAASQALWGITAQVYTLRQFQPAWQDSGGASSADVALRTLENASAEGLHPEDYGVSELRTVYGGLAASADPEVRSDFDRRLTYALVRYVSHLCFGRIDPRSIDSDWPAPEEKDCDVSRIVQEALQQNSVDKLADQLSPKLPEYVGLKAGLKHYHDIAAQGWQQLPPQSGKAPRAVANSPVATNLILMGDLELAGNEMPSQKELDLALRNFQARHGIQPDARSGKQTIAAMNVPVEMRIEQIEINMDRMRWIAHQLAPHHIRVNIPGFQLSVHDGGGVPLQMRAIVGSEENPTPVLDSSIQYLVFSPYWNIPLSIATKELLPMIKKDPRYLRRENIEVVRGSGAKAQVIDPSKIDWEKTEGTEYQLRQKPGVANALGLVKFIFPNPYDVYLHDTPSDNLFDRLTRTLSHGCIRVERPTELAAYVLQDQPDWTPDKIEEAMHAEKETKVPLKTPLPIHLLYWTAWADAEGKIQFREDVYGYDAKHRELTRTNSAQLPTAHASDVDVNEVGAGVVPDASRLDGERGLSK